MKNATQINLIRQRLGPCVLFVRLLVGLLLCWSAINGFYWAFAIIRELSGQDQWSFAVGLLFAGLYEAGKFFFGAYTLRLIIRGWVRDGSLYRFAFIILLPITIGWFWGSYWLSTSGSLDAIRLQVERQTPAFAIVTPINTQAESIKELKEARDSLYNRSLSSASPRSAAKIYLSFQEEIRQAEEQGLRTESHQDQRAAAEQKQLSGRLETVLSWIQRWAGFSELLSLLLLVFLELYSAQVKPEECQEARKETMTGKAQIPPVSVSPLAVQSIKYLKLRIRQCRQRAYQSSSSGRTRENNLYRSEELMKQLQTHGIQTIIDPNNASNISFKPFKI